MKFSLKNFVMKTLTSMKSGGEDEYKIMQYALKYYEKGVLTEEDLAEVQSWFETEEPADEEPVAGEPAEDEMTEEIADEEIEA